MLFKHVVENFVLFIVLPTFGSIEASENTCDNKPFQIKKDHLNKHLIEHAFLEMNVSGHHACAKMCFPLSMCKSINYYSKYRLCELNDIDSMSADSTDFETNIGAIYSDITEWPPDMAGSCGSRPCAADEICLNSRDTHYCQKIGCGKPGIIHGKIMLVQENKTWLHDTATVECNRGYISDGESSIKCLASGQWEHVNCIEGVIYSTYFESSNGEKEGEWLYWGVQCPHFMYAAGYSMMIQPDSGEGDLGENDDTALNGVSLTCKNWNGEEEILNQIYPETGPLGTWGTEVFCGSPGGEKHFLVAFNLQVEKQGAPTSDVGDYTAVNYIKFKCRDLPGKQPSYELEVPKIPGLGSRGTYSSSWSDECPNDTALCMMYTRLQHPQGNDVDDTAVNDVRFLCCK